MFKETKFRKMQSSITQQAIENVVLKRLDRDVRENAIVNWLEHLKKDVWHSKEIHFFINALIEGLLLKIPGGFTGTRELPKRYIAIAIDGGYTELQLKNSINASSVENSQVLLDEKTHSKEEFIKKVKNRWKDYDIGSAMILEINGSKEYVQI